MNHLNQKLRESLAENNEEMRFIGPGEQDGMGANHDNAIVGVMANEDGEDVAVYDMNIIIQNLMDEGMTDEEAIEFYEYNIERTFPYFGKNAPAVIRGISGDF